jgi:hypothetical protein
MPLTWKAHSLYMRWCLDCHRAPEQRVGPVNEVFVMSDEPRGRSRLARLEFRGESAGEQTPIFEHGIQAIREHQVRNTRLEDCSICHR